MKGKRFGGGNLGARGHLVVFLLASSADDVQDIVDHVESVSLRSLFRVLWFGHGP